MAPICVLLLAFLACTASGHRDLLQAKPRNVRLAFWANFELNDGVLADPVDALLFLAGAQVLPQLVNASVAPIG